ncbi:MAG TPA: hypothetical protein VG370_12590 [Chloroflexota bacterium]|nr:hypothetical protein [Chloroflexota bacterium]
MSVRWSASARPWTGLLRLRWLVGSWLSDRPFAWAAIAAVLANAGLYLYVWWIVPGLPELIPLHYDPTGTVDQIGRPGGLFRLPIVGSLVLVANLAIAGVVHLFERTAGHVLVWTALGVQVVLAGGVWLLIAKAAGE